MAWQSTTDFLKSCSATSTSLHGRSRNSQRWRTCILAFEHQIGTQRGCAGSSKYFNSRFGTRNSKHFGTSFAVNKRQPLSHSRMGIPRGFPPHVDICRQKACQLVYIPAKVTAFLQPLGLQCSSWRIATPGEKPNPQPRLVRQLTFAVKSAPIPRECVPSRVRVTERCEVTFFLLLHGLHAILHPTLALATRQRSSATVEEARQVSPSSLRKGGFWRSCAHKLLGSIIDPA